MAKRRFSEQYLSWKPAEIVPEGGEGGWTHQSAPPNGTGTIALTLHRVQERRIAQFFGIIVHANEVDSRDVCREELIILVKVCEHRCQTGFARYYKPPGRQNE